MKFTFALLATAALLSSAFAATTLAGTPDYDTVNYYYEGTSYVNEGSHTATAADHGKVLGCFNDHTITGLPAKAFVAATATVAANCGGTFSTAATNLNN